MDFTAGFKSGISTAYDSFCFMWHHKIVLAYYGIITVLQIIITVSVVGVSLHAYAMEKLHAALYFLMVNVGLQYVQAVLFVYMQVVLTVHIASLLNDNQISMRAVCMHALHKWRSIILWAAVNFFVTALLLQLFHLILNPSLYTSLAIFGFAWVFFTFFVPTAIALEVTTFVDYFHRSIIMMRHYLFKIAGSFFWIGIILFLCMMPIVILYSIGLIFPSMLAYKLFFTGVTFVVTHMVSWIIMTVTVIFKTILYVQYTQGIEDFEQLQYPQL